MPSRLASSATEPMRPLTRASKQRRARLHHPQTVRTELDPVDYRLEQTSSSGIGQQALAASALLQPMMREYRPMAAPFVERGLADPTDQFLFRGCHGVLDRTTDGVDPQNAQPALHCDRGRDAADAVWRALSGCRTQGQRPGAGLCREPAL